MTGRANNGIMKMLNFYIAKNIKLGKKLPSVLESIGN